MSEATVEKLAEMVQDQSNKLQSQTNDNIEKFMTFKFELRSIREKAEKFDAIGERLATLEAYDKIQDGRLNRMEERLNELAKSVAENSVKDLLSEERSQNREQTKQIAALTQMAKEERSVRQETQEAIRGMRDVLAKSSDKTMADAAKGIVINVEGARASSDSQTFNESVDTANVAKTIENRSDE